LSPLQTTEHAVSAVTGVVLLTGITILLMTLVLLICLGFRLPSAEPDVPDVFRITNVNHFDRNGKLDYNSYITLENTEKKSYQNHYLYVKLFVNDVPSSAKLPTLNGDAFCHCVHTGVQNIGGLGTNGNMKYSTSRWYGGQKIFIDFSDGTFRPGDTVRIEIYDSNTNKILSRDTWPHTTERNAMWFYNYFLNPRAA